MREKLYVYSEKKNKVLEVKKVDVVAENKFGVLCRITTIDNKEIYEKRDKMLNVYNSKEKAEKEQKLQEYKENYECVLRQRDDIAKNATEQIESLIDEKNKYKSLYENEKDKNDTLKRIIKKIEKYIEEAELGNLENDKIYFLKDDIVGKTILDLLKEIK